MAFGGGGKCSWRTVYSLLAVSESCARYGAVMCAAFTAAMYDDTR